MQTQARMERNEVKAAGAFTRWARRVHLMLAWAFVASVAAQVFLAGRALFADARGWPDHVWFGYSVVGPLALAVALSSFLARIPALSVVRAWLLFLAYFVQTMLPGMRMSTPLVAALHPVNALLIFWLGITVARRAGGFVSARTNGNSNRSTRRCWE